MHIKDYFRIPEGDRITDKAFSRILLSSICGILLCMGCLVGTTWAWFVVSVESPNNVIEIATATVDATILQGDQEILSAEDGSFDLAVGSYTVQLHVDYNATAYARPIYVLMTATQNGADTHYYLTFDSLNAEKTVSVTVDAPMTVRFATRWSQPVALPLSDSGALIGEDASETTTTTKTAEATTTTDTSADTTTTTGTETTTETETETTTEATTEATTAETEPTTQTTLPTEE